MPIPTYAVGQVLSAADCSLWFIPLAAVKTSDTSRTSNITLANDPDLVLPVAASATYEFSADVRFTAGTGPGDLSLKWTGPAGAVLTFSPLHNEGSSTGLGNSVLNYGIGSVIFVAGQGSSQSAHVIMRGTLVVAGTAGNLTLQWAQNTSSGTATTVQSASHLV